MENKRIYYIDNLKTAVAFLVILHHAAQGYMGSGSWVYHSNDDVPFLRLFSAVNASFFMGLFFFCSGFFVVGSQRKKSALRYVAGRAKRLLIPALLLAAIIVPLYRYIALCFYSSQGIGFFDYYINTYIKSPSYEHGWFLVTLFVFSALFALYSFVMRKLGVDVLKKAEKTSEVSIINIVILFVLVAIFGSVCQLFFPIDRWVTVLFVFSFEPAHIAQYALMFIAGIFMRKRKIGIGKSAGICSTVTSIILVIIMYANSVIPTRIVDFINDFYAVYEAALCVSLCVSLCSIFSKRLDFCNRITRFLSNNSFGAYVFQSMYVVIFALLFDCFDVSAIVKWLSVFALSAVMSFLTSYLLRKIKVVKSII